MYDNTTTPCLLFPETFSKPLVAQFDQLQGSSDGGAILLKAAHQRLLKLGSKVLASVRRVAMHLPVSFPFLNNFRQIALSFGALSGKPADSSWNILPIFRAQPQRGCGVFTIRPNPALAQSTGKRSPEVAGPAPPTLLKMRQASPI